MGAPPRGGGRSAGCVRCFGTNGSPPPWSSLQPGTDDSELREAARRPDGAGAAGWGRHGRLHACLGSAAGGPSSPSDDGVDSRTVRFLLGKVLARKKVEEERRQQVQELLVQLRARAGAEHAARYGSSSSTGKRRKRKRRKKRRRPRSSSRPSRCSKLWRLRRCSFSTSSSSPGVEAYPQGRESQLPYTWWLMFLLCALVVVCGHGMCMAGLLVTLHPAVCSLACRPFVADNSGSTRLVLLVTKHLTLYSLYPSSGPRCATSWPVWT